MGAVPAATCGPPRTYFFDLCPNTEETFYEYASLKPIKVKEALRSELVKLADESLRGPDVHVGRVSVSLPPEQAGEMWACDGCPHVDVPPAEVPSPTPRGVTAMNHVSVIGTEPMRVIPCPPRLRLCAHGSRSGSPSDMPGRRLLLNGELIEGLSQLETLLDVAVYVFSNSVLERIFSNFYVF